MDKDEREKVYRLKAQEAEQEAARTKDAETRASWLKIAKSYRQLAGES